MSRRIEIAGNIIGELLNYLMICSAAYIFMEDFAKVQVGVWALLLPAAIPVFFYCLREWCELLWLFLLLHAVPLLGVLLLYRGNAFMKVMLVLQLLIFAALSIAKRINSARRDIEAVNPIAATGFYLVLFLLDNVQGGGEHDALLLQLLICFCSGYFIYYFLQRFLSYIDINTRTTENIPIKNVFFSSAGLAAGFTAAAFALVTVCANRELMGQVSEALRRLIRWLLSFIKIGSGEVGTEIVTQTEHAGGGMPDLGEMAEPSLLVEIIDVLLTLAVFGLILFLCVRGCILFVRLVKEGFHQKGYRKKLVETEYIDQVERISHREETEKTEKTSLLKRWKQAASPEEKIRRIYKKTVWKSAPHWEGEKQEDLLGLATARECCMELFDNEQQETMEFVMLYEKARYGSGLCTSEDVRRIRDLSERLHRKVKESI